MKIRTPKTKLEDMLESDKQRMLLQVSFHKQEINQEEFNREILKLENQYSIHSEDIYIFEEVSELVNFLDSNSLVSDSLLHEEAHAKKAEERGYKIKYGCRLALSDNQIYNQLFITINSPVKLEDLNAIVSAVDDPSMGDKVLLANLREGDKK